MFLKSERKDRSAKAPRNQSPGAGAGVSYISGDTRVGGDLAGVGEVRIDGEVGGDVYGRRVSIGAGGNVIGDVFAAVAVIAGRVQGRIEASSVSLAKSAEIGGTITHNILEIEAGAQLGSRRPWRPPSYFEQHRKW